MPQGTLINRFWLGLFATAIALSWLLPNHYLPWLSFHADAWMSLVLLLLAVVVLASVRKPLAIRASCIVIALLTMLAWLQVATGLLTQAGVAWVVSSHLLGLLLAVLVGSQWEAQATGELGDLLFLAIGLASVASVGIELYQWLELQGLELWIARGARTRPHANLGQPNQLGTLLLWGLLASTWAWVRHYIGAKTVLLMALFLLFGIALTASRTAWLGLGILILAAWVWRAVWPSPWAPWIATGLGLYFAACTLFLSWMHQGTMPGSTQTTLGDVVRMSGELRPLAWATLLDAAWREPWFGYGWGQVAMAQMAVATQHPNLQNVFSYAHNLFIDLVVWCGIPLGVLISFSLLAWLYKRLRAVQLAENAILCMLLLVVGNHALLEMPLYYGYFLFPVGLVVGALDTRLKAPVLFQAKAWWALLLWLICTIGFSLIVKDYFKVEASYKKLQAQWDNIQVEHPVEPPEVLLLTQWADYIRYIRIQPAPHMQANDLLKLEAMVVFHPNLLVLHQLAMSLALNHRSQEAELWLHRMCKATPEPHCQSMKAYWEYLAQDKPAMAAIRWPAFASESSANQ